MNKNSFDLNYNEKGEILQSHNLNSNNLHWIDIFCLFWISLFSLFYSKFGSNFAELYIQFNFLNFPIFIGEILLGACFILLIFKVIKLRTKLNIWHYLFLGFLGFIILKALLGYYRWGALSFRNAALFYYAIFAIFSYNFYNKKIIKREEIRFFILIILIILVLLSNPSLYYKFIYYILISVLFLSFKNRLLEFVGVGLSIYFFCVGNLFNQTKGMLVSLVIAFIFLLFTSYHLLINKIKIRKFRLFAYLAPFIILFFIFNFLINEKMRERIQVWTDIKNTMNVFMSYNRDFKLALLSYKPEDFEIKLYEENGAKKQVRRPPAKKIIQQVIEFTTNYHRQDPNKSIAPKETLKERTGGEDTYSILWRMFVWREMIMNVYFDKKILGEDFGNPFRSISLESSNQLMDVGWCTGNNVGWLEPHNSYIHILYRAGFVGLSLIIFIWVLFIKMTMDFIKKRNLIGVLLCSALLFWLILANFIVFLELPYFAIPFWSLFGLILAYDREEKNN